MNNTIVNRINSRISFIIFFCVTLVFFYFLNLYTNIAIDDFTYKNIITNVSTEGGIRVRNLSDIIVSQYHHYFITNGRLLVNGLAQIFLISDNKNYFNVANTLVFGILLLTVLKLIFGNFSKIKTLHFLILVILFWFLIPGPNHTLLWLDGSFNYLWATVLVLLFIILYQNIRDKSTSFNFIFFPVFFIFGFICGFTHEVLSIGISGALCIDYVRNYKHYTSHSYLLVGGYFVGTLLLVFAPGNLIRLSSGDVESHTILFGVLQKIYGFISSTKSLLVFWLLFFSMVFLFFKNKIVFHRVYKNNQLLVHSILISLLFIIIVGAFEPRVFFGVTIFSICILFSILNEFSIFFSSFKTKICLLVLFFCMLFEYTFVVRDLYENKKVFDLDEKIWFSSKDNIFPERTRKLNRFVCKGLGGSDRYFWSNIVMSYYYHKDYMIFIPDYLYKNIIISNKIVSDKNIILSNFSRDLNDSLNIYLSSNNKYLLFKIYNKKIGTINSGAHIQFNTNEKIILPVSGFISKAKSIILNKKVEFISKETMSCFLLNSKNGNYIVSELPKIIPFTKINNGIIFKDGTNLNRLTEFKLHGTN